MDLKNVETLCALIFFAPLREKKIQKKNCSDSKFGFHAKAQRKSRRKESLHFFKLYAFVSLCLCVKPKLRI